MKSAPACTRAIATGWRLYRTAPNAAASPAELDRENGWDDAVVPGTVAATVFDSSVNLFHPPIDIDDFDWWYETEISVDSPTACALYFEGLATIAEVWVNGKPILRSQNMFRAYRADVAEQVQETNTLTIVFRSLSHALKGRRPRPRWKTNLINNQQLRWIRTTLLGRIPGWTPPVRPVGPWRSIALETECPFEIKQARISASHAEGISQLTVNLSVTCRDETTLPEMTVLSICGKEYELALQASGTAVEITGAHEIPDARPWWPHTHGTPALHAYEIIAKHGDEAVVVHHGAVGFRDVSVNRENGMVELRINGHAVFARGGCWTSNDFLTLAGNPDALRRKLMLIRDAGVNMIRIGGTMVYESDLFYALCDELGILVWQDLMLANMDYPVDDDEFANDLSGEIRDQVERIGAHPCAAVFCGGNEIEQQAAMFGMDEHTWVNPFFYETVPEIIDESGCGLPYFTSSPCEGALPFHNASGIAHYFGVGAYKQGFSDLAKSRVKFTSECLAFSNVPDDASLKRHFKNVNPATHTPAWKAGVPRDAAAGWDFEDIRDHYIRELYGVDPVELRYADNSRYLAISQVVTGEIMEHVFNQWRSDQDACSGGLIWWLNDIVPGAGWGMLDSDGNPKPLYYFLRRCWAGQTLSVDDRGLDGLFARITNESREPLHGTLRVRVLQHASHCIAEATAEISVDPSSTTYTSVDQLLGRFFDTTYSYRFGPEKHDVVVVELDCGETLNPLTTAYFPGHRDLGTSAHPDLVVETESSDEAVTIHLQSKCFLKNVKLQSPFFAFGDNYFDLPPGTKWVVTTQPTTIPAKPFRATLSALNLEHPLPIS